MSLITDKVFCEALRGNTVLMGRLAAGDVYNTAIPTPDEDEDNEPLPYLIITYDGMRNEFYSKDEKEGLCDSVQVGIEIAAGDRGTLGEIAAAVRETIRQYFSDADGQAGAPQEYTLNADAVQYDSWKPCYWQVLHYDCLTLRD